MNLAYVDLGRPEIKYLISGPEAKWDVERFELSHDGTFFAYVKDEDGVSVIHVRKTVDQKEIPLRGLQVGVVTSLHWLRIGHELGFWLANGGGQGDGYSMELLGGRLDRWIGRVLGVSKEDLQ